MRKNDSETGATNPNKSKSPIHVSRRTLLVGGGALVAALIYDTTASPLDLLGTQKSRKSAGKEEARQSRLEKEGQKVYAEAFFGGPTTTIVPGQEAITVVRNPELAKLRDIEFHNKTYENPSDAYYRYYGVIQEQLHKDYPTWDNPPHVRISKYDDNPHFYMLGREYSELIGLPIDPNSPGKLLIASDGGDAYEGDITVSMGDNVIRVTNSGLGEHGIHMFTVPPEQVALEQ